MSETLPVPRLKKQSQSTLSASAPALIPISDPTALRKVATGVKKSDVSAASLVPKFGMPAFESTFAYEHHAKEYAKALDTYDFEQVLTLIEYGFPIDYADHRSETALIKAAGHEHGQGKRASILTSSCPSQRETGSHAHLLTFYLPSRRR